MKLVKQTDGTFALMGIPAAKSNPEKPAPFVVHQQNGRRNKWDMNGKAFINVGPDGRVRLTTSLNFVTRPLFGNTPGQISMTTPGSDNDFDDVDIEINNDNHDSDTAPDDLPE